MEIGGLQVRTVTLDDGRVGCAATPEILRVIKSDPGVRLDDGRTGTAEVLRSGRLHAEVHGRLRRARRLPSRTPSGPVLLIRPE
jgi:hypothetical protein